MNMSLTSALENYIKDKVDSKLCCSSSRGLRALQEKEFDRKVAIGIAQAQAGLGIPLDSSYVQDLKSRVTKKIESVQS